MADTLVSKDRAEIATRRKSSGWREKARAAVRAISEQISEGLFLNFKQGEAIMRGARELDAIGPAGRVAIWTAAFPGIAREVEIAWSKLTPQTIARRDAGPDGNGEFFTWKLSEDESLFHRINWLRKLLIAVGPYPELDFPSVIRNLDPIACGRIDESVYSEDSTGLSYDTDAPAYAACAVLSAEPESNVAREVEEILRGQLLGKERSIGVRPIFTAFLCAERLDLWDWIDENLAQAGIEAGFREALLGSRRGTHPGAWLHLLRTIRNHQLLRFPFVEQQVKVWFGIQWQWKSSDRQVLQSWLERWIGLHESPQLRSEVLQGNDPGDFLLALWAEAIGDGDAALARVAAPSELTPELRLAAAHFLSACPGKRRARTAISLATDSDLRVAAAGGTLLTGYGSALPSNSEMPDLFENLISFVTNLPGNRTVPPTPTPFPQREFHPQILWGIIAERFPDGAENVIERFLPELNEETRQAVVRRLNRYQLSTYDRDIARVLHGRDPEQWAEWEADHRGDVLLAQRRLLFRMMDDRSVPVAEHAYKAVKNFTLTEDEFALIRPVLNSSSTKKRLCATKLLAAQPAEYASAKAGELLQSNKKFERMSGLEVLRALAEDHSKVEAAKAVWNQIQFKASSAEETRAEEVVRKAFPEETVPAVSKPSLHNAFGMVDPAQLLPPHAPQEHPVLLHSPVTQKLIDLLDNWLLAHADDSVRPWKNQEMERLADSMPYVYPRESPEENFARFPTVKSLVEEWRNRPPELRDPDGREYYRLGLALHAAGFDSLPPLALQAFFGTEKNFTTKLSNSRLKTLLEWIKFALPEEGEHGDVDRFLIDAAEAVYVRLPEKEKHWPWWSGYVLDRLDQRVVSSEMMSRLWALCRNRPPALAHPFTLGLHSVAQFFNAGVASEAELTWHLIGGPRRLRHEYERERAFASLRDATARIAPGNKKDYGTPEFQTAVQRIVDRLLDLELSRGEETEEWSYAAKSISQVFGARNLQRLLKALGSGAIKQKRKSRYDEDDFTRPAVLQHLISVSLPREDESPEEFSRLMREASLPVDQLLEVAMLQPSWIRYVEDTFGLAGIRDAIGWVFAHTRSRDYVWNERARLLWAGELSFQTAIPAEEFIAGVVDIDWFIRIYKTIGEATWSKLYQAARLASTGSGHTRARLYSDALLDRVSVKDLEEQLLEKGNLDAGMAIGLPGLPTGKKQRESELLRRYEILQKFRKQSRRCKPQRRASEEAAFQVAVQNLARRAGYSDTLRFEWIMETQASADLAAGTLQAKVDEMEFAVIITPTGTLELQVVRGGSQLNAIPGKYKKHAKVVALRERMAELKEQAQRIRPGLESLMERGLSLPVAEWRQMLKHPLAGPLLSRLVLVGKNGVVSGMPSLDSEGLVQANGTIEPWPDSAMEACLAHPVDLLPLPQWRTWQQFLFAQKIVQPFKQVFRELYLITESEAAEGNRSIRRYSQQQVVTRQALSILSNRGWVFHPERGLHRIFRTECITAWIVFTESFHHPGECENATILEVLFTQSRPPNSLSPKDVTPRIFSEVMRDVDLIVSVAHATGATPEISHSTIETRASLIRETCAMLGLTNVQVTERHAEITGSLANYRIHLASGNIHRVPGAMIPVQTDPEPERGRIFLPFAENDPISCSLLTKVILFAHDETIKDPRIARMLREQPPDS